MNRQEKTQVIDTLKKDFSAAEASFVLGVQGLTVDEVQTLRKNLHVKNSEFKVAKNTLLKIAVEDMGELKDMSPYFKNQVAVVFARKDASDVANVLYTAAKANEKLKLIGGSFDKKAISASQVEYLAKLPSREVLLAKLAGTLQAPMAKFAGALNQMVAKLAWALKEVEEKKK